MKLPGAVLSVLLVGASAGPLATAAAGPNPGTVDDPSCQATLTSARESHGHRFSTRCNFAQTAIRITLDSRLCCRCTGPRLSGDRDPGDRMRCGQPDHMTAECTGRAGSGVRIGGYLQTKALHCRAPMRFRITGGPDCPPEMACPAVAYIVRERFTEPTICGSGA